MRGGKNVVFLSARSPGIEIISVLVETGIAALKPNDLANSTADVVCSLYINLVSYVDPLS